MNASNLSNHRNILAIWSVLQILIFALVPNVLEYKNDNVSIIQYITLFSGIQKQKIGDGISFKTTVGVRILPLMLSELVVVMHLLLIIYMVRIDGIDNDSRKVFRKLFLNLITLGIINYLILFYYSHNFPGTYKRSIYPYPVISFLFYIIYLGFVAYNPKFETPTLEQAVQVPE